MEIEFNYTATVPWPSSWDDYKIRRIGPERLILAYEKAQTEYGRVFAVQESVGIIQREQSPCRRMKSRRRPQLQPSYDRDPIEMALAEEQFESISFCCIENDQLATNIIFRALNGISIYWITISTKSTTHSLSARIFLT